MIRLTEIERDKKNAVLKLEGYITSASLRLLDETFVQYRQANISSLLIHVDGLQSINFHSLQKLKNALPADIQITFSTTRPYLNELLANFNSPTAEGKDPPDSPSAQLDPP